jgi:acetoin utilization deacetylase AcuC-like enzyme
MEVTGEGFGALAGIVQDIARETCPGRILITLEGGYNPEGLRNGVRAVLLTLLGKQKPLDVLIPSPAAEQVIERITKAHRKYWKSLT